MKTVISFLKQPSTKIGISVALMFQIIFSVVWMTGYNGITDRVNQLKVVFVNQDLESVSHQVVRSIRSSIPFQSFTADSKEEAMELLEQREVQLVVILPENFSKQLFSGSKASIHYVINESNPTFIKSVADGIVKNITSNVNKYAIYEGAKFALSQSQMPSQQLESFAVGLSERVKAEVEVINPVTSVAIQMIPMMMVLSSYVGAMLMSMQLDLSSKNLTQVNKWSKFLARGIINIFAAVIISMVGTSFIAILGGQIEQGFITLWLYQTLFMMTFLFVAQVFLFLFGAGGMIGNILMLSIQLVTSGAMVPREMLSQFFHSISNFLPATYAVEGIMNIVFGGPSIAGSSYQLLWIMIVAILIGVAMTALKKNRMKKEITATTENIA